ncbi:hypothetical protein VTO42DRAFT_2383 [Malbranchea cinnamomea]
MGARKMLSSRLFSWQLFLVVVFWICAAAHVKSWGSVNNGPIASRPASSIEGARRSNSFFSLDVPSAYTPKIPAPSKSDEQSILSARDPHPAFQGRELGSNIVQRLARCLRAFLPPTTLKTQTPSLRDAPFGAVNVLLETRKDLLSRFMPRRWERFADARQRKRDSGEIYASQVSSQSSTHATKKFRTQLPLIHGDSVTASSYSEELDLSPTAPSFHREDKGVVPRIDNHTSCPSTIILNNDLSESNSTTEASKRRFHNPLSISDFSSGRSKAQGSCFGLIVGMIVAIVWL